MNEFMNVASVKMHHHLLTPTGQLIGPGDTEPVQQGGQRWGMVIDVPHLHLSDTLCITAAHVHPVLGNFLIVHPTSHQ